MLQLFEEDGVTPVENLAFTGVEKGADSDPLIVRLRNTGLQPAENIVYMQQTEDPEMAERWLASGVAPQDELWGRVEIIGFDNAEDPTWSIASTAPTTLGASSVLLIPLIPPGCDVSLRRKLHVPASASNVAWRIADTWFVNETARPLPVPLSRLDRGIATFAGDYAHRGVLHGCRVTASGSPDDEVHCAAGLFQVAGAPKGKITTDHTLNQNDGAAAALAAGQSYIAIVTLGAAGETVRKGTKATSPAPPTVPADEDPIASVSVTYQVGGTSVIEEADITDLIVYERYYAEAGVGLQAVVHAGEALANDSWRWSARKVTAVLVDDDDNYIWLTGAGGLAVNQDLADPPDTAALPIWRFTTASGVITEIEDLRRYLGKSVILRFTGATPADVGDLLADALVEHPELHWEYTAVRGSDNGGGVSGLTQFDCEIDGVTAYTSSGTEDLRPSIPWDAGADELVDRASQHEVCVLRRGNVVAWKLSEEPTGGSPERVEILMICRVP
jgi:hypothetical protein